MVSVGGVDLRTVSPSSLHACVTCVAQDAAVFAASIEDNLRYGSHRDGPPASDGDISAALSAASASDFVASFPAGLATLVGERGVRLSGGQRQRLALARALLRAPKLLILDEATSSLDADSERAVQRALDALVAHKAQTVLLIAHRLSTVRDADAIAVVEGGVVAESGPHAVLLSAKGTYARLIDRQLEGARRMEPSRSGQAGMGGAAPRRTDFR